MKAQKQWLPTIALLMAALIWGSSFVALKLAFRSYHPMLVIFGRMAAASLIFLFFIKSFRGLVSKRTDWLLIILMAFCEPCLYFIFEAWALSNTTASQAGMIVALLPLMVAVAARVVLKEEVSPRTMAGFILAIIGAVWLSLEAGSEAYAPNPLFGNFLEFVAMICATGYVIILKWLTGSYPPLFLTAVQVFVGSIFYLPLVILVGRPSSFIIDPTGLLAILYLGVVVTLGAYGSYNYALSRIPANQASVFINLIPVFTIIMASIVLGESFTWTQYAASGLVLGGVVLSQGKKAGARPKIKTGRKKAPLSKTV